MNRLLSMILSRLVRDGTLCVTDSAGKAHIFGAEGDPDIHMRFTDAAAERAIAFNPMLAFAESYMDGKLVMEKGSLYEALDFIFQQNTEALNDGWIARLIDARRYTLRRLHQLNTMRRSRRNVAHHYDLSNGLYELFLDEDRQYSCAYFETADATLDEAQLAKKRHLISKLDIQPGHRVLDIGCGWGGMGLYIARECGAEVVGVTLSSEQHKIANERAESQGLGSKAKFLLRDYRALDDKYDRIISVGMFEHVGVGYYRTFFDKCRDLLTDDGVMQLHSIGRLHGPAFTNPFVAKYIFPGGYIPAMSEVLPQVEKSGLIVTDIEILRLHYAMTLRHWRERFMNRWNEASTIYDERFCRMWEFYLSGSEISFRYQGLMNFQIQMSKSLGSLPLTRDYMVEAEDKLRKPRRRKTKSRKKTDA